MTVRRGRGVDAAAGASSTWVPAASQMMTYTEEDTNTGLLKIPQEAGGGNSTPWHNLPFPLDEVSTNLITTPTIVTTTSLTTRVQKVSIASQMTPVKENQEVGE